MLTDHIRKVVAGLIYILLVIANRKLALGLSQAEINEIGTVVATFIIGLSIFDAAKAYKA